MMFLSLLLLFLLLFSAVWSVFLHELEDTVVIVKLPFSLVHESMVISEDYFPLPDVLPLTNFPLFPIWYCLLVGHMFVNMIPLFFGIFRRIILFHCVLIFKVSFACTECVISSLKHRVDFNLNWQISHISKALLSWRDNSDSSYI